MTAAIMKRIKGAISSMDATKWFHVVGLISAIALGVGFVTAVISVGLSWRINQEQKVEIANALKDAGLANEKAGKANERAEQLANENLQIKAALGNVQTELANARTRQAQAENETLRLKQRIRPRSLEPAQRENLLNKLRNSPSKGAVSMYFQLGDGEAAEFALELREVLEKAGWQPSLVGAIPYVRMNDLHVCMQNDLRPPHRANMLLGALRDAGLPARETTGDKMQDDAVALVVGFKSPYR